MDLGKCGRGGYRVVSELPSSTLGLDGWNMFLCRHVGCICVFYVCMMLVIVAVVSSCRSDDVDVGIFDMVISLYVYIYMYCANQD